MEHFSYKSEHAMWVAKHLKEGGLLCYCNNFSLKYYIHIVTTMYLSIKLALYLNINRRTSKLIMMRILIW